MIPTDRHVKSATGHLGVAIDSLVKDPADDTDPKETLIQLHQLACRFSSLVEALNGEGYLDGLHEAAENLEEMAQRAAGV